ncbi:hypothetical protein FS749_007036, partial [Ceratobasidium sp. UAMH 11750]
FATLQNCYLGQSATSYQTSMKYKPGPVGRSCLTCRQRRKKCDQTRPLCERCRRGGFECLGYDCLADSDKTSESPSSEDLPYVDMGQVPDIIQDIFAATITSQFNSTSFDSGLFDDLNDAPPITYSRVPSKSSTSQSSQFSRRSSPGASCNSLVSRKSRTKTWDLSDLLLDQPNPQRRPNLQTLSLLLSMPQGVSWVPADIANTTNLFMTQFQRIFGMSLFRPAHQQVLCIRDTMSWRLQNSASARWAMYVCMKMFDFILEGNSLSEQQYVVFRRWMQQVEEMFYSTPLQNLNPAELQVQLCGSLEFALFRLRLDNLNTYELLKSYAPTFLQIVSSDPTLWLSSHDPTPVSLAHVLGSYQHELPHFAILDIVCSMAYALPQVVNYDTSITPREDGVHPIELVYGCPLELQTTLVDINILRSWEQVGPITNWHGIEQKLQRWQPTIRAAAGEESWKMVARLAVQETWRHTLLVYLYMAVCGAVSNEARVESSVRQVFQIMGTLKHELEPVANAHFFMQYLFAGAFTPNEKHRALSRAKLLDSISTRFWLLDTSYFVPILDHLWHGAAADGRPIRWSDYVGSRETVMPTVV